MRNKQVVRVGKRVGLGIAGKLAYGGAKKVAKYTSNKITKYFKKKLENKRENTVKRSGTRIGDVQSGSNTSIVSLTIYKKGKLNLDKTKVKIKYFHTYDTFQNGVEGIQGVFEVHALLSISAFLSTNIVDFNTTTGTRNPQLTLGYPLFIMNPNTRNTGSTIILPSAPESRSINVESINQKLTIWNSTSGSATIHILWCAPVLDTGVSPTTWWNNCITNQRMGVPIHTYMNTPGATVPQNLPKPGSLADYNDYGIYPSTTLNFNKMWKIAKAHKCILEGGDSRTINLRYIVNKCYDLQTLLQQSASGIQYMRGSTLVPMIIAKGGIAYNTGGSGSCVWAATQVGVMIQESYVLSTPKGPPPAPISLAYYGTVAGQSSVTEKIINDDDLSTPITKIA